MRISSALTMCFAITLLGCGVTDDSSRLPTEAKTTSLFKNNDSAIPFGKALRRKWGGAVVADLDQDGWEDVITTHHGIHAQVYWNNGGVFSEPVSFVKGDTHGLGVSDLDGDGLVDIVVAQGGGDGSGPRRPLHYSVGKDRSITLVGVFDYFTPSRGRSIKYVDADKDTVLDLFVTGFAPRQVKELTTNQLYRNKNGLSFYSPATLAMPHDALSVKAITTDVNNDGATDVIVYGGRDLTLSQGNGKGGFDAFTQEAFGELSSIPFVNGISEIDFDNDGDFDLFLTRSRYQFEAETYYDDHNDNLAFFVFRDNFLFDELEISSENLVLENVQETYATYDIQLGKLKTVVKPNRDDSHMGGSLVITPEDAAGWPEDKELKGIHIGYLGEGKWRIGGYVKSRFSAVVRHVSAPVEEKKRGPLPAKLLENQNGVFVDVTEQLGIDIPEQTTQSAVGDFNNDGFMDIAIARYGQRVNQLEHLVLMNKGGKQFIQHSDAGLKSEEIGATGVGMTTIDFDQDGHLDLIFGNERGRWYLAENNLSDAKIGNFIVVKVDRSPTKGAQPIGARVDITACGKKQSQHVGASGEGFHHMLKTRLHFGLGDCEVVDKAKITWTNGEHKTFNNINAGSAISS